MITYDIWWTHVMNTWFDGSIYLMNTWCDEYMWFTNVCDEQMYEHYDEHMPEYICDEQIYCICYEHMQCNAMKTCL